MRRLSTIAMLAVAAVLTVGLAACGSDSGSSSSGDPQAIVDEATLRGIESGDVNVDLAVDVTGKESGHVDVTLAGPFQGESAVELPELDLTATAKGSLGGEAVDFDAGVTLLGEEAFVRYEGTEYEVDPTTLSFIRSILQERGGTERPSEISACQEAFGGLKVGEFIDRPTDEGTADVGGTSTTKIGGELDVAGAIGQLIELTEDPACRKQLDATGQLPSTDELEEAKDTVADSVEEADVELYVGDDHIIRRVSAVVAIEPPPGSGRESAKSVDLDFDMTLTGVNEEQEIEAPQRSKLLSELFLELGVSPLEVLALLEGKDPGPGVEDLLEGFGAAGITK